VRETTSCAPFVLLPADRDEFRRALGKKVRANLRRAERALTDLGQTKLHVRDRGTDVDDASLGVFFGQHEARWGLSALNARGYDQYRPFITDAFRAALSSGLARYITLEAGGQWLAGQLCFDHARVRHLVMVAFNPTYRDCDPGLLLALMSIDDAIGRGLSVFDFGDGIEEYKLYFAAHTTRPLSVVLGTRPVLGGVLGWLEQRSGRVQSVA